MSQLYRQPQIIEMVQRDGAVSVEGLADHFGVTLQTIRRDLSELAALGKLERVHGGAILPSGTANIGYEERRKLNQAEKTDIARACAELIPHDCSLFLNIGTTTEALACKLLQHDNIMVVTNNMNVANILTINEKCQVILTGGTLRRSDGGLVGTLTTDVIRQFKFDYSIIGCSALDKNGDFLDFDIQEVSVSKTIIEQSRKIFLVADHTKFSRNAPARIGSLSDIDCFITDKTLSNDLANSCKEWNTDVIIA